MKPFEVIKISEHQGGKRILAYSVEDGEQTHTFKDSEASAFIPAGSVFLHGPSFEYIAGPVTRAAMILLAEQIVEGNQRVLTLPGITLNLAMGILGFMDSTDADADCKPTISEVGRG